MNNTKIISGIIFTAVGQLIALNIRIFFNQNYFIPMIIASTTAFLISYRGKKVNEK